MAEAIGSLRAELGIAVARFEADMGRAVKTVRRGSARMARSFKGVRAASSGFAKSLLNIRSAAVAALSGVALIAALRAAVRTVIEFNDAIADLSAITGAAGDDLAFLAEQSRILGRKLGKGAAETAKAFKLIASAKPDLLKNVKALAAVTKAAVTLAVAAGITLPEAATALGNSLNQFNAGAKEAARFMNVLAAGAKFGASEIPDVTMALRDSGTVARGAGVSFEELNALIQILAASGIKAAKAGVGLRNMILRLQTGAKETNPELVGMVQAVKNLGAQQLSATEMMKRFGMEGIVVAKIIIDNADKIGGLTKSLTDTQTAADQARIKMDTLGGDIKRLGSSYENLELAVLGASDSLARDFIQSLIKVTNAIANLFGDPGNSAEQLRQRIAVVKTEIESLEALMIRTAGTGSKFADALETTGQIRLDELRSQLKDLQLLLAAVTRQSVAAAAAAATIVTGGDDKNAQQRLKAIKAATQALKEEGDAISLQIGKLSVSSAEWARLTSLRKALLIVQKAGVTLTDEEIAQLVKEAQQVKVLAERFETLTEQKKKDEEVTKEVTRAADELGVAFSSSFEDAVLSGKKLSDILNALLEDIARIAFQETITRPFTGFLRDLFSGFMGFRHGGQFTVGGSGGADSQMVAFKATPGETVTVGTPGAQVSTSPVMVRSEVEVNVFAPPGTEVQTRESAIQGARRIDILLDEQMAKSIVPGTRTFRAIQGAFAGMTPNLVGR